MDAAHTEMQQVKLAQLQSIRQRSRRRTTGGGVGDKAALGPSCACLVVRMLGRAHAWSCACLVWHWSVAKRRPALPHTADATFFFLAACRLYTCRPLSVGDVDCRGLPPPPPPPPLQPFVAPSCVEFAERMTRMQVPSDVHRTHGARV